MSSLSSSTTVVWVVVSIVLFLFMVVVAAAVQAYVVAVVVVDGSNNVHQQICSPFAAVSLCGVAGLAETFPSFPVSGTFLPDVPGFQVPTDSIFPPRLRSSARAIPLHLHFDNCSDVFCFISSFDVHEPFQPSPSHNHRCRFHLCFLQYLLISLVF